MSIVQGSARAGPPRAKTPTITAADENLCNGPSRFGSRILPRRLALRCCSSATARGNPPRCPHPGPQGITRTPKPRIYAAPAGQFPGREMVLCCARQPEGKDEMGEQSSEAQPVGTDAGASPAADTKLPRPSGDWAKWLTAAAMLLFVAGGY